MTAPEAPELEQQSCYHSFCSLVLVAPAFGRWLVLEWFL